MMENIPATGDYLILGLAVVFGILLLLIASMVVRYRNLRQDEQLVEQLDK